MLATFDSETRGLFGEIFRLGYYDDVNGYTNFYNGMDFIEHIEEIAKTLPDVEVTRRGRKKVVQDSLNVYAFNLEFDFSKVYKESIDKKQELNIDYDNSLIINGRFNTVKLLNKNIYFKDILPIVNSNLETAADSFNLYSYKTKLNIKDKERYFKTVDKDDIRLLEYMKSDVLATYELVQEIKSLSNLPEEEFVKCPTNASLAMRVFKNSCSLDYETIKKCEVNRSQEDFIRKGYFGGRAEVFKPVAGEGFHYDVNSLYPYVMEKNWYPKGRCSESRDNISQKDFNYILKIASKREYLYMVDCMVEVPDCNIAPLPVKMNNKLLFPVGKFSGVFTSVELEYAVKNCNVKICNIKKVLWWTEKTKVFEKFISEQKHLKMTSKGGKRLFAKLMQNSLYGKLAMQRQRIAYQEFTEEKQEKIRSKGGLCARIETSLKPILKYEKIFFADYIRPHYAAFVTSYARVELLNMMLLHEKNDNDIYYCDTDSIVTNKPIQSLYIDDKEYGKWKVEREIEKGLFLLPKLYAEVDKETGEEVLKSKGIIKEYRDTIKYDDYVKYYEKLVKGIDVILYGDTCKKYYGRKNLIQSIQGGEDIDVKVLLKKRYVFSNIHIFKRVLDFGNNRSKPIRLKEE